MTDIADVYEELRSKGFTLEVGPELCFSCGKLPGQYHEYTCSHFDSSKTVDVRQLRQLVYMMHPLGSAANRERNRALACRWQAEIQHAHPEWVVVAPWIGLSGAWQEDRREEGMTVDLATIDLCSAGVIAGPLDGPCTGIVHGREYQGVSPGMALELAHFGTFEPQRKPLLDARTLFKVELPVDWTPPRVAVPSSEFKPLYVIGETVIVENKPRGLNHVRAIDETAPGVYRYTIENVERFFAHEQSLGKT